MLRGMERYRGSLLGLAAGDALGTTLEFKPPGSFEPITDMEGGGPFGLGRGQWTDDTSMALCLAESLTERGGFDAADQMDRYLRWMEEGYWSSTGSCFDVGNTVRTALLSYKRTGEPFAGSTDPFSAGNGSLMRLAPVPLFYAAQPQRAVEMAAESSCTTHGARTCLDACRYYAALIIGALAGTDKDTLLAGHFEPEGASGLWHEKPLCEEIADIAAGSFQRKEPPEIEGSGYVVKTLEAALWAFDRTEDFAEGALVVANLGDDADTTAAVYGQLAGAYYGKAGIPAAWRAALARGDEIAERADRLRQAAGRV
jgi:ADP-ribosylglycohydrolase